MVEMLVRTGRRVFLALFLWLGATSAAFAVDPVTAPDIARILKRGTLVVVATVHNMPPFFYVDSNGRPGGIDVDLANDIAQRLGVRLEFARIAESFDDMPRLVAERQADVAIGYLSRTLRRAAIVRFTQPYVRLRQTLMLSRTKTAPLFRGSERVEVMNAPDVAIGVEAGSAYVDFTSERFPKAQVRSYPSVDAAIDDMLAGKLHGVVVDEAFSYTLNHPIPGVPGYQVPDDWALYVKVLALGGAQDPIAMAVHRDDHSWLSWLDTYIADRLDDGTLDKIVNRYLGAQRP